MERFRSCHILNLARGQLNKNKNASAGCTPKPESQHKGYRLSSDLNIMSYPWCGEFQRNGLEELMYVSHTNIDNRPNELLNLEPRASTPGLSCLCQAPPRTWLCGVTHFPQVIARTQCHLHRSKKENLHKSTLPSFKKDPKETYNTRDSLVVTHPTTSLAVTRLSRAERTGCRVF